MGMIACYFEASSETVTNLLGKSESEVESIVMEMEANDEVDDCDIDKSWDGLHFLLTGDTMAEMDSHNLLSVFVIGDKVLCNEEGFVAVSTPEKVKEIAAKVNSIDIATFFKDFDPADFVEAEIYPRIWEEDKEGLVEYLEENYAQLKQFYNRLAKEDKGIIVSIW